MRHPRTRAERRHERERVIARRRFIHDNIWFQQQIHTDPEVIVGFLTPFTEFGRYAKFNLGCGCKQCHSVKYFGQKRKRRRARRGSFSTAEFRRRNQTINIFKLFDS